MDTQATTSTRPVRVSAASEQPAERMAPVHSTQPASKDRGILYIGIDLGTSQTSVSASNGVRETIPSYVGYPKDMVARKLLKRDVLFGHEALEKRLSLDLYRPLGDGVIKQDGQDGDADRANMRAAKDLIREIIARAKPRKDELIYAVIGAPAQASIHNKRAIVDAARETVDSVMLCSEPFSVAYGLDWLEDVLVIDIGAGTTDLCRMHGTMPEDSDQLTTTFAGDYVDHALLERMRKSCPGASFTIEMVKAIKEKHADVTTEMSRVVVNLPVDGKPTPFDVTDDVRAACRSIVPAMVEGLGRLVASFHPEFQDRLKNRVLLAGGGSLIKNLDRAIEEEMERTLGGGRVVKIDEPVYGGANGALKIAHDMPADYWEKLK